MIDEKLLTIAEMAERLNIPPSNAAYYIKKFKEYMPSQGEGRKKRYEPAALEILQIIVGYFKNNLTAVEIEERLNAEFTREISTDETTTTITTTTQQQQLYSVELMQIDIDSRRELIAAINELTDVLKQIQRPRQRRSWWFDLFRKGKH